MTTKADKRRQREAKEAAEAKKSKKKTSDHRRNGGGGGDGSPPPTLRKGKQRERPTTPGGHEQSSEEEEEQQSTTRQTRGERSRKVARHRSGSDSSHGGEAYADGGCQGLLPGVGVRDPRSGSRLTGAGYPLGVVQENAVVGTPESEYTTLRVHPCHVRCHV